MTAIDPFTLFTIDGLSRDEVREIAHAVGLVKRERKIDIVDVLTYLCQLSLDGTVSYNDLAGKIGSQTGNNVSRQAYHAKMGKIAELFFQKILERLMQTKRFTLPREQLKGLHHFTRILVQDSTIIRLPLRLFELFSGVRNAHTAVCNARIQGTYDLLSQQFTSFSIDPYSRNDQEVSPELAVEPGDLVLRDRGYFSVPAMKKHKEKGKI